jgi:hypothetical protein
MPRLLTGDEVFESLSSIAAYREVVGTHGDSTTSVASVVGTASDTVVSGTNFVSNDPAYIVGDQGAELNEVSSIASNVITWKRKRLFADAIGALVKEMLRIPLGHIGEDSAEFSGAPTVNAVPAATSKTPIAYISVGGELTGRFSLTGFNILNVQLAFGAAESELGTGTPSDPYQGAIGRSAMGFPGLLCFRATGLRKDASVVEVDFVGVTISGSPTVNISGKTARPIPVEFKALTHIVRVWK